MSNSYLEIKNVDFTISGKTKVKNASFVIENEGDISPSFSITKDAFLTLVFPLIVKSTFFISK